MEELFRFIMTRPPQKTGADTPSIAVTANPDYLGQLRQAKPQGLDAVRRVARAHAANAQAAGTTFGDAATRFAAAAAKVEKPTLDALKKLVKTHFDMNAPDVVADNTTSSTSRRWATPS